MARDESFKDYVLDQLHELPGVSVRAMFGGFGLYAGTIFFGIVSGGRLYLKTSDATRSDYERRGMRPFQPTEKQTLKRYYEVPPDVVEDADQLVDWAGRAVEE